MRKSVALNGTTIEMSKQKKTFYTPCCFCDFFMCKEFMCNVHRAIQRIKKIRREGHNKYGKVLRLEQILQNNAKRKSVCAVGRFDNDDDDDNTANYRALIILE